MELPDRIFKTDEGWEMDDGSGHDSYYRYQIIEGVEPWEVSRSDGPVHGWNIDKITIFSLFFIARRGRKEGTPIFRELALHPLTSVQVDYLYLEG